MVIGTGWLSAKMPIVYLFIYGIRVNLSLQFIDWSHLCHNKKVSSWKQRCLFLFYCKLSRISLLTHVFPGAESMLKPLSEEVKWLKKSDGWISLKAGEGELLHTDGRGREWSRVEINIDECRLLPCQTPVIA